MKISLYHNELATILKALSPFTNPCDWESEEFEKVEEILKREILGEFRYSVTNNTKIFYPNEWDINFVIDISINNENYITMLICCDNPTIIQSELVSKFIEYKVPIKHNKVCDILLNNRLNIRIININKNEFEYVRGFHYDYLFL